MLCADKHQKTILFKYSTKTKKDIIMKIQRKKEPLKNGLQQEDENFK